MLNVHEKIVEAWNMQFSWGWELKEPWEILNYTSLTVKLEMCIQALRGGSVRATDK
jgi:hypothetical protein